MIAESGFNNNNTNGPGIEAFTCFITWKRNIYNHILNTGYLVYLKAGACKASLMKYFH